MSFFQNLSIKYKLGAGIIVFLLLLYATITITWKNTFDLNASMNDITYEHFPSSVWGGKSLSVLMEAHGHLLHYLNKTTDMQLRSHLEELYGEYDGMTTEELQQGYPEDMLEELRKVQKGWFDYRSTLNEVFTLVSQSREVDAIEVVDKSLDGKLDTIKSLTNLLIEQELEEAREKTEISKGLEEKSHQLYIFFIFISLLITAGVMYAINLYILKPIQKFCEFAETSSRKVLTHEISAEQQDEVGYLAETFNAMNKELKKTLLAMNDNTSEVDDASQSIALETMNLLASSEKGALAIDEISSALTEVEASIKEVANNSINVKNEIAAISRTTAKLGDSVHAEDALVEELTLAASTSSSSIQEMEASINSISSQIAVISEAVNTTANSTGSLSNNVDMTTDGIKDINDSVENINIAIARLTQTINDVAKGTVSTREISDLTVSNAQKGQEAMREAVSNIADVKSLMSQITEVIENLSRRTEDIGDIVRVISEIADQTNLLALNASIEAARAGEHGRGFAVVADEVGKLAERSADATKEIAKLIDGIQKESTQAVKSMKEGNHKVDRGVEVTQHSGVAFETIIKGIFETQELVGNIEKTTVSQLESAKSVNDAVNVVSQKTGDMAHATDELQISRDEIVNKIQTIRQMSGEIVSAVREQEKASGLIVEAAEKTLDISEKVSAATSEQTIAVSAIVDAVRKISLEMEGVSSATSQQAQATSGVNEHVSTLQALLHDSLKVSRVSFDEAKLICGKVLGLTNTIAQFQIGDAALLKIAIGDHLRWVGNIRQVMKGHQRLAPDALKSHFDCRLGKWYYSKGMESFKLNDVFLDMERPHRKVHDLGIRINQLVEGGKVKEAEDVFHEMEKASREVVAALEKLIATSAS